MKTYELINPSDQITFVAESREIAALTVFSISTQYGASYTRRQKNTDVFCYEFKTVEVEG